SQAPNSKGAAPITMPPPPSSSPVPVLSCHCVLVVFVCVLAVFWPFLFCPLWVGGSPPLLSPFLRRFLTGRGPLQAKASLARISVCARDLIVRPSRTAASHTLPNQPSTRVRVGIVS